MIGEKIQKLRRDNGLTVRELAVKAQITPSMISNFETNQKIPGRKVIAKLATAFEITETELLVELRENNGRSASIGSDYIEKLKSVKSEKAITLIINLIDFCLEKEKTEDRFERLKSTFLND